MKNCTLCLFLLFHTFAGIAQKADLIEQTSYNDDKRGTARTLQYHPEGKEFVCINGKNRYTRALYGGPTAFRLETGDRPVFAAYIDKNSQHISFWVTMPGKGRKALDSTSFCEARYLAGKRSYLLRDSSWGNGELRISVLAFYDREGAVWKIDYSNMPAGSIVSAGMTKIRAQKLFRSGDMGADPPGVFEAPDKPVYTNICQLEKSACIVFSDLKLSVVNTSALFDTTEKERAQLADRMQLTTPDPFINPIAGALVTAADGIWDGKSWLHGAIGWRMPLTGWRAAYAGDFLGMHDRARIHFDGYAASQVTNVPNTIPHPAQDTALDLARAVKKWGTPMYSNGYIARNPDRPDQMHHYDMNLVYIDALLWHLQWTGDLAYAKKIWPVLSRHLAWEKLNFDPDNDGLYDAYACIWASDGMYYNSGAVTYSSAYNCRANKLAALIAEKIGEDPLPYRAEATKILSAIQARLWLPEKGHWAEYQDYMGLKRVHGSAGVYTIYHAIDSDVPGAVQAFQATRYLDTQIPHIPVKGIGLKDEGYATIATSNWMPYTWSTNNVAFAEVMHTALAYFEAGRNEAGFQLFKSAILDGMYLGDSPGNFGQISFYDAARGECYRDFGDAIGVAARLLVQGLFGIRPDALNKRIIIRPGFPASWPYASLKTPDLSFDYKNDTYHIVTHFPAIELQIPAKKDHIKKITVNGKAAPWQMSAAVAGTPLISINIPAGTCDVRIEWAGKDIVIPPLTGEQTTFKTIRQGEMTWLAAQGVNTPSPDMTAYTAFSRLQPGLCEQVNIDTQLNAALKDIFQNEYRSPRSPYTTLQIPLHGIGEWTHPKTTAAIAADIKYDFPVPFRISHKEKNVVFTSLWDNYPDSVQLAINGKANHAYLLLAGSTNSMQSRIENGRVTIVYKDGSRQLTALVNPETWCPVEQDYFTDSLAFKMNQPKPWRLHFKTGLVSQDLGRDLKIKGVYGREIDGGAGMLLDIKLDPEKELSTLTLQALSNDVVVGLMALTLQRSR
ncbi:DUF4450 domain-containing protein [Chitinophaga sancti]|uniref:DUF4450 domain-containing protein n=1 Tax=Chitinophaga sancti TaxID=1004 RepID=A0A1K1N250_9BACT|nr:DUF4450 domain-containing protein [Chitinophaga sancti]WQD63099.1 DUF4450 domain-containing protein [Chitinophaga sancti]WQG91276.1 DUF4450 domain-containing protein [Chitinophaga sancti]SFW28366.1 protein of unknown function [Chitinophaga sancti]